MMNAPQYAFRPARRSEAKPLVGLYAESGCGKTWSALLLARGFSPQGRIGMIETEGGRGEAFVGRPPVGEYLVRPIRQNFSPIEYGKAITEAENASLDVLIIDSASHEWEGDGGVLAMAAAAQASGKKGPLVWQQPKIDHQRHFMLRLMQTPIPLVIVCMRAKYPMVQVKSEWQRSTVLEPKQADDILFEMLVHGWIDAEHNLHVTKYTIPDLESVIVTGKPITTDTGRALAQWAAGTPTSARTAEQPAPSRAVLPPNGSQPESGAGAPDALAMADLSHTIATHDEALAFAAKLGMNELEAAWKKIPKQHQPTLKAALDRRHKPNAAEVGMAAAS
jgi:hypothetical protein